MSHRQPIRVADIAQFDAIIDARTPAEFALDRIPGAINCPVLSNEERVTIGTIYKQVSPFEAKRLGAAMVAANLAPRPPVLGTARFFGPRLRGPAIFFSPPPRLAHRLSFVLPANMGN